ncbi:hypothetical protein BIW11_02755 [Tropilaelaps mercedesae]|uniref:Uncharacterized protein n=1 Tax=Tropilaelaps mercedesae TaxID=418985 RepID=A0A1V9XXR1_9ACAR|nr:hypothetical protein BIW11_02755 [Tropilaelaps mercedesae]
MCAGRYKIFFSQDWRIERFKRRRKPL